MTVPSESLRGKTALVSGAAGGLGRAITRRLLAEGARVALLDLAGTSVAQLAAELSRAHPGTIAVACDLTREQEIDRAVEKTINEFGTLEILVNNAGIAPMRPFLETNLELYDRVMSVNARGSFALAVKCAPHMAGLRSGCIVQIASTCAFTSGASSNLSVYNMSKAAVRQMVASLAGELAPYGIRVNAIAPGNIDTAMTRDCLRDESALAATIRRTPLGRLGQPDDVAAACAFLCSGEARYMTGATLVVDGGWMVR